TAFTQEAPQSVGLGNRAREPIENKALLRIGLLEALAHQADHDLVGHQLARAHVALRLPAERGALGASGAQHVAGGDLRHTQALSQDRRLGAFAAGRWAKENESHAGPSCFMLDAAHSGASPEARSSLRSCA